MELNHNRVFGVVEISTMRGDTSSLGTNSQSCQAPNVSEIVPSSVDNESASTSHRPAECQINKGGLPSKDLNAWTMSTDPTKINKLSEILENSTSLTNTSKCLVDKILQQINQLTDIERLHLYLKLPGGRSPEYDPLKQPLNPLGNRSEIAATISWVRTHLNPNPDVSIPKKEIYTLYENSCKNKKIKPLNTADFGKVMKQVFPDVNPRRLGNRGKSRYCYSGLGINDDLSTPKLPLLGDLDIMMDNSDSLKTHTSIILDWADKCHKIKCNNLKDLALSILKNNKLAHHRSHAANLILSCDQNIGDPSGSRKEVSLQLQKTIQEREFKRKYPENQATNKNFSECVKTRKRSSTLTRTSKASSQEIILQNSYSSNANEDVINSNESDNINNNSVNKCFTLHPKDVKSTGSDIDVTANYIKQETIMRSSIKMESEPREYRSNVVADPPPPLQKTLEASENSALAATVIETNLNNLVTGSRNLKLFPKLDSISNNYKSIQPKDADNNFPTHKYGHITFTATNDLNVLNTINNNVCSNSFADNISIPPESKSIEEPSNSSIPYSHQPLNNNNDTEKELRKCLNIIIPNRKTYLNLHSDMYDENISTIHDTKIPQSPNTIGKAFEFAPINTNVGSGSNTNQVVSQCSSANVSPFTSPTNTPLTRSRNNSGQTNSTYITPRSTPFTPDNHLIGNLHSENSTPFVSPASTPLIRSRHNSTPFANRVRHSSGAPSCRHNPYTDDASFRRSQKYPRTRNSSGNLIHSAPLSPLIHDTLPYSQDNAQFGPQEHLNDVVFSYFKKDQGSASMTISNDRRRHISSPANYYQQQQLQSHNIQQADVQQPPPPNYMQNNLNNDIFGQEIANAFINGQNWSSTPGPSNRPQSVPLPQMLNSSNSSEVKSYPTTPNVNSQFTFGPDSISHPSSFSSTPVASENLDYDSSGIDKDPFLANLGGDCSTNPDSVLLENLNPISTSDMVPGFADEYCLHQSQYNIPSQGLSPVDEGFPHSSRNCCPSTLSGGGNLLLNNLDSNNQGGAPNPILGGGSQLPLNNLDPGHSLEGTYDHTSHLEDLPSTLLSLEPQDFSSVLGYNKE